MPLEKLVERILSDAREESLRVEEDARKKRDRILAEADREAEEIYREKVEAARSSAENEKKQRVAMAGLDARKGVLEEKQELIQEVFDRALQEIGKFPPERYMELMVKLVVDSCGDRESELLLSEQDRDRMGNKIVKRANQGLERAGKKGRVKLSEEVRDITGGFILRSGGVEINESLESLIHSRKEELESKLVEILFGEPD